jgi:hypothetical protein
VTADEPSTIEARRLSTMPVARRRYSVWTVLVPIALSACVYVVASIIGSTRWTLAKSNYGHTRTGEKAPALVVHAYTTRPGDTWRTVARKTHVSTARLHALNPNDTAKGPLVPGEHLLVRP